MNYEMQRAVWQRVRQDSNLSAAQAILPEKLTEMIADEKRDSEVYRQLALKLQGADAALVRRMSAEEVNHGRELNTLYYLLTGRCTDMKTPQVSLPTELREALRTCYWDECSAMNQYHQTAEDFPEHAELFQRLSAEEKRHGKQLSAILQRNMK